MNSSVGGSERQQKVGGLAALYLAAAFVVAMPFFLVFVKYPSVVDPVEKVALLVRNHDSMRVMYLITYVIFGIVLAVLALALHARLRDGAPALTQAATAVGLIWAVVLVASGMIFNAGDGGGRGAPRHRTRPRPYRPGRRSSPWLKASVDPAVSCSAVCGSCW